MFINRSVAVQWQWKIFLRSCGLIWFLQGMQERRRKWQFLPKEKGERILWEKLPWRFKDSSKKNIREYLQSWFGLGDIELAELTTAGRFSRICYLGQLFGFWCASFPGGVSLFMGEEGQSLKKPCSSVNWGKNPTEFTESKIMAFCNQ